MPVCQQLVDCRKEGCMSLVLMSRSAATAGRHGGQRSCRPQAAAKMRPCKKEQTEQPSPPGSLGTTAVCTAAPTTATVLLHQPAELALHTQSLQTT